MGNPLPEDLGRLGSACEETFKSASIGTIAAPTNGTITNHGELTALDPRAARASVQRLILRNSEKDGFADLPGAQEFDLTVEHLVTDLLDDQYGDWIETSFGEKVAASTLESFSSGNNSSVTKSNTSAVYDAIIRVPAADGNTYHVPLKTKTSTVATFAFLLPGATTANAKPKNASETGGAHYADDKDGAVNTFEMQVDQADFTGEIWVKAKGAVPVTPFRLVYTPNQLLKMQWTWKAATWTASDSAGGSGLADPTLPTEHYQSDVVSFGLQSLASPAVLTALRPKALSMSCGYGFDARMGGQGISGTTIPGSAMSGWNRRNSGVDRITVTIDDSDWKTWDDARVAKTEFFFWVEFQPGNPGGTVGASRLCIFRPQVKVVSAAPVKVDGQQCTALELMTERRSGWRREYISVFGTS